MFWDVFLSYSGHDLDDATVVHGVLQEAGLSVWFDRLEVRADEDAIPSTLSEGLVGARVLCVLCSRNSLKSEWVQRELMQFIMLAGPSARRQAETGICFLENMAATVAGLPRMDQIREHGTSADMLAPMARFVDLSNNLLEAWETPLNRRMVTYVPEELDRLGAHIRRFRDSLVPPRPEPLAGADFKERIRHAEQFWQENDVMARSRWVVPDFASLLARFDAFRPPHDQWPQRPETARGARIRAILESVLVGSVTTAANVSTQRSLFKAFGLEDRLVTVFNEGSLVSVLVSMAVDSNLLDDLQQAHYRVRTKLFDAPGFRDLVDLSVILAGGYCVDRWVLMNVPRDRVIDTVLAEGRLAELA